MIKQINPQFKNYQGDIIAQAVIVIEDISVSKEQVKVSSLNIKRTSLESYDVTESEPTESHEAFSEVKYTAKYWFNIQNFQKGNKGYFLEGAGGELEFTIEMDQEWIEVYKSIQGTDTQRFTKLCEIHAENKILPELRAL